MCFHVDRYILKGMSYMICKKSGWTGEFPSCEGTVGRSSLKLQDYKAPPLNCNIMKDNFKWVVCRLI